MLKFVFEIDVGKQADHVDTIVILEFQDMYYVKWHINVFYQGLQNRVGKNMTDYLNNRLYFFLNIKLIPTTVL